VYVTLVHIHVNPEHRDAFIAASLANHQASVQEPGNLRFDVLQSPEDPDYFVLYEAYRSAGEAALHKQTAHYRTWRDTVAGWMSEPRQGVPMNGLFPAGD
jgi:autoinducer 2-degrading protein